MHETIDVSTLGVCLISRERTPLYWHSMCVYCCNTI